MNKKEIKTNNFLDKVREYVPEFRSIEKEEAVDMTDGEHYIMGTLKRFAENAVNEKNQIVLKEIAIFLDRCWNLGEYEIHNAVMVSFFEKFSNKSFKVMKSYLSPLLLEEAEFYRKQ